MVHGKVHGFKKLANLSKQGAKATWRKGSKVLLTDINGMVDLLKL
jgi:hypothetical protein